MLRRKRREPIVPDDDEDGDVVERERKRRKLNKQQTTFLAAHTERRALTAMALYRGALERMIRFVKHAAIIFFTRGVMPIDRETGQPMRRTVACTMQQACLIEEEEADIERRYVFCTKPSTGLQREDFRAVLRAMNFMDVDLIDDVALDLYLGLRDAKEVVLSGDMERVSIQNELVRRMRLHFLCRRKTTVVFVACTRAFRESVDVFTAGGGRVKTFSGPLLRKMAQLGILDACTEVPSDTLQALIDATMPAKKYTSSLSRRIASALGVLARIMIALKGMPALVQAYHSGGPDVLVDPLDNVRCVKKLPSMTRPLLATGFLHKFVLRDTDFRKRRGHASAALAYKTMLHLFDCWSYQKYREVRNAHQCTRVFREFESYLQTIRVPPWVEACGFCAKINRSTRSLLMRDAYFMRRLAPHSQTVRFDIRREMRQYMAVKTMDHMNREGGRVALDEALKSVPRHAILKFS